MISNLYITSQQVIEWASALVPPTPFFRLGRGSASERPQMGVNSLGEASEVTLLQTLVHVNARSSVMGNATGRSRTSAP